MRRKVRRPELSFDKPAESKNLRLERLLPERVLHFFASLLQVPLRLVAFALGFERLIVRYLARRFFDVTFRLLGFVLGFVDSCHDMCPLVRFLSRSPIPGRGDPNLGATVSMSG